MLNLLLVLIITGGLALFALQNLTPISLVILGQTTLSLPLAIWILLAIAAGVATSLLIAGLYRASNAVASRRAAPRRASKRNSVFVGRFNDRPSEPAQPYSPPSPPRPAPSADDWESDSRTSDDWDDWDAYEEPHHRSSDDDDVLSGDRYTARQTDSYTARKTESYAPPRVDRAGQRVANPDPPLYDADFRAIDEPPADTVEDVPYEPEPYSYQPEVESSYRAPQAHAKPPVSERPNFDDDDDDGPEEWEDWDGYEEPSARAEQPATPYTGPIDFEVRQEPKTAYRSGTVYSYSYRDATDDSGAGRKESVRRPADQPLITPPPASDQSPKDTAPPPDQALDDDWGFDDEFDAPKQPS